MFRPNIDQLESGLITRTQKGVYFTSKIFVKYIPFRIVVIRPDVIADHFWQKHGAFILPEYNVVLID